MFSPMLGGMPVTVLLGSLAIIVTKVGIII